MQSTTNPPKKKRYLWNVVGNVFVVFMLSIFFLVILAIILVQTVPVQNYIKIRITNYLEKKLTTRVEIGKLNIQFPNSVSLYDVYLEDLSKDTLLSGGKLKVDLNMFRLLKNELQIKKIDLENITLKVKRLQPDTVFNFQFIVNAFSGNQPTAQKLDTTASMKIDIDNIIVNNTRIIYRDIITGNDMNLFITHFDTKISTFDPSHMYFNAPSITLNGVKGYFYQNEPLKQKIIAVVPVSTQKPNAYPQFKSSEILLNDIDVDYKSVPSYISTSLKIGNLIAHPDKLNLKDGKFDFKDLAISKSDIGVDMGDSQLSTVTPSQQQAAEAVPLFTLKSNNVTIKESNFKVNYTSMPVEKYGMDYGHLDLRDVNMKATNFLFNTDTIYASIKSGSLKEKSGFVLNELTTDLFYTATGTTLTNLYLKTPGTLLQNKAVIRYPSLDELVKNPGVLYMELNFVKSHLLIKDLLTFAPILRDQPAFSNPSATWLLDGRVNGRLDNLHLENVQIKEHETSLYATGTISGLPDPKKISADLNIPYFNSTRRDIEAFLPKNTLPKNFTLPDNISASGRIKGNIDDVATDISIKTSLGSANVKGILKKFSDAKKASYDLAINASSLNIGKITGQPDNIGMVSTNFVIKGTGYDPATANARVSGVITSAEINKYTYHNVKIDGTIANKNYTAVGSIHDPNIDLSFDASGSINGKYPSLNLTADIDSIKTLPLHLGSQDIVYHGKISAEFTNIDPDNLAGNLIVTRSILVNNGQRMQFDSLQIIATSDGNNHHMIINSDFLNIALQGRYKLTQLADVFQQAIDPYFSMSPKKNAAKVDPYSFSISGSVVENAALKAFFPSLSKLKPVSFGGHFASDSGWSAFVTAPYMVYGSYTIDDVRLEAITKNGALTFNSSLHQLKSGSSIAVYATTLNGSIQNNNLDFTLNIKDGKSTNKYTVSGMLSQPSLNNYSFSLKPDNLLLNYLKWSVSTNNSIQYFNKDFTANNFILSQGSQQLSLNTIGSGTNKPLSIDFKNFSIATLTGFIQNDSLLVNGTLNGNATVKNLQVLPTFTTDLSVNNLSIYNDTLGDVLAKVNNTISNQYNADITLTGRGNNVNIQGNYFVKPQNNSSFDLTINVVSLQTKSLEGFTHGGIHDARGNLYGKITLNGTLNKPNIDGKINFNNTAFVVSSLNSLFKIDKEVIVIINNKGIELNKFTIRDTANNAIVFDGAINTADFINYTFDLKINADNFQAINSTKKDNRLFYGKMVFSTELTIRGTTSNPIIDGNLTINDKTNFTVVLPQDEPGVVQREGIVRFVDYSATHEDSLFMAAYDSLKMSPLQGYNVSVNISVSKNATFNLIVDEGNGDFLKLKGEGQLTGGIDESGKITLVGSYEINEGSYDLSFNFIKRKFIIQKGSRIVWTGEPTTAEIDITAIYIANTPPLDLVQGQTEGDPNTYKQKLPFEVHLTLAGEILKPQITFDIILPEEKNYNVSKDIISTVEIKLIQLRQEPGELNKQVFALLLLNRFVGQNPFDNSSGGSLNANTFARQSVSKLLTEQLNKLTEGLIAGVDINFDLATTEDYTTGNKQNRTDFNVAISKQLLNDRLTVTVGSNFELEGPLPTNQQQNNVAGNIAIDYKLSKDGKYMLRAYRKNDYEGALEGYIIETGVSFIISVDYNRFKEILHARRNRKNLEKKNNSTVQPTANNNQPVVPQQK